MEEVFLDEEDARAIVRLLGALAGLNASLDAKRTFLMEGLRELIDADTWTWSLFPELNPDKPPTHTIFLHGGFREGQLAEFIKVQEHSDLQWMTAPFFQALLTGGSHISRSGDQMTTKEKFRQADVFPLMQAADVESIIASGRRNTKGEFSVISLFRRQERPWFTARETRIAHILLSEVTWLHEETWPDYPGADILAMAPRQRTVLSLLLQGMDRKEIAHSLDIAVNTVHGYAREIYQIFKVHSQPQLMRRFMQGDGGDLLAGPPSEPDA